MKKLISILLCLLMVIGIVPLSASAASYADTELKLNGIFEAGAAMPVDESLYEFGKGLILFDKAEFFAYNIVGEDWDYTVEGKNSDVNFTAHNGNFKDATGYKVLLRFLLDQDLESSKNPVKYDVNTSTPFTLKTNDSTYTSYKCYRETEYRYIMGNRVPRYYAVACFYIPISEMGRRVSDFDTFKSLVDSNENVAIRLNSNITKEIDEGKRGESNKTQMKIRSSVKKWINLDGKKLIVKDKANVNSISDYLSKQTLFTINENSVLTIDDTSGGGELVYEGAILPAVHVDGYRYVAERNLFDVNGKLIINGGSFVAGNAKKQYHAGRFFNAYQIVAGYIADAWDAGEVIINGGKFTAHTHFNTGNYNEDDYYFFARGNIKIRNGEFISNGIGGFFEYDIDIDNAQTISFDSNTYPKILTTDDSSDDNIFAEGRIEKLNLNIPNTSSVMILKGGKICYSPDEKYLRNYAEDDRIDIIVPSFEVARPEFPKNSTTTSFAYRLGTGSFESLMQYIPSKLPQYLIDQGYKYEMEYTLADSSDNVLIKDKATDKLNLFINSYCKNPGLYKLTLFLVFRDNNDSIRGLVKYTVIITVKEECEEHEYYVSSTTATCTESGIATETCTICGVNRTDYVGPLGHTFEEYDDPWSYTTSLHWKYCYRCNESFNSGLHLYRTGSSVCNNCGYDKSCKPDYNAMDMNYDKTHHWYDCETHGEGVKCPNDHKMEYEDHTAVTDPKYFGSENASTTYNCTRSNFYFV